MLAINTQPAEKPVHRDDGSLDIVSVWRTVQGEGPYSGLPAVFLRTAGCSILCRNCDSDYTTGRHLKSLDEMTHEINRLASEPVAKVPLVVITGGEPFRQNITPLVMSLLCQGMLVQIETNGTIFIEDLPYHNKNFTVVCSPKTPTINKQFAGKGLIYKYVLRAGEVDVDGLPTKALGSLYPARPLAPRPAAHEIYLQPEDMDVKALNESNMRAVVDSCMKFGYRLCLQQHKIVGLA